MQTSKDGPLLKHSYEARVVGRDDVKLDPGLAASKHSTYEYIPLLRTVPEIVFIPGAGTITILIHLLQQIQIRRSVLTLASINHRVLSTTLPIVNPVYKKDCQRSCTSLIKCDLRCSLGLATCVLIKSTISIVSFLFDRLKF